MNQDAAPKVFVIANFVQACCWFVPHLPGLGETLTATALNIEAGGKGFNVAVGLRRLGANVYALLGVGQDDAGVGAKDLLVSEGVNVAHLHVLAAASGYGSGHIAENGTNAIAVFPGANLLLNAEHADIAQKDIASSKLVYGQFEVSLEAVARSFEIATQFGVETVLNPSPWQPPPVSLYGTTRSILVNEVEACRLLNLESELPSELAAARAIIVSALPAFWARWQVCQLLVVTLGPLGAIAFEKGVDGKATETYSPAAPTVAVDTVGAGDAFACGFCSARIAGEDLLSALRWGNAAGGYMAARAGVLPNLLDKAAFQQQLN